MDRSDWQYTVGVISGGHFISHLYLLTLPPLFPLMRNNFGWGPAELGLVISVLSVGGLLQPVVGSAVDRLGAKRLLTGGLVIAGTGLGLIGVADSLIAVTAFAFVSGVGQAVFHPADYAIIDAVTSKSTGGKGFSVHTLAGYLGFAAAPVVVGTLGTAFGWRTALFVVGCLGPAYGLVTLLAIEPVYLRQLTEIDTDTIDVNLSDRLRVFFRPATVILLGVFLAVTIANKSIQSFTGLLFLDGFGLNESVGNTALTVFFAAVSVSIPIGGVLADRRQPRSIFAALLTTIGVTLALGITLRSWFSSPVAVGLFGIVGCGYGLALPSRDRIVNSVAPTGSTGRTFGFVFAGISLGGVVGPASVGAFIEATSITSGFYVIAAAFIVATGFVQLLDASIVPRLGNQATPND
jgi:MFS family permease